MKIKAEKICQFQLHLLLILGALLSTAQIKANSCVMLMFLVFEHIRISMWCGVKLGHELEYEHEHEHGPISVDKGPIYRHVHEKIEVTQGIHIFQGCLGEKGGEEPYDGQL